MLSSFPITKEQGGAEGAERRPFQEPSGLAYGRATDPIPRNPAKCSQHGGEILRGCCVTGSVVPPRSLERRLTSRVQGGRGARFVREENALQVSTKIDIRVHCIVALSIARIVAHAGVLDGSKASVG